MRCRAVAIVGVGVGSVVVGSCSSPAPDDEAGRSEPETEVAAEMLECPEDPDYAGPADYEIPRGWFFTQRGCGSGVGHAVTDDPHPATGGSPARFFTFFALMGGTEGVGFPSSTRFVGPDGRVRQLFDGGLAVADPATGRVTFDDVLARAGADEWDLLVAAGVPPPAPGAGLGSGELEAAWRAGPGHPAWCPFEDPDAASLFGLPLGPMDPATGTQPFERVVLGADGTLAPFGDALATVEADQDTGAATFVPADALLGESAPAVPGELEELHEALEALALEHDGEVSVAVTDLQTGETVAVEGDRKHFAASSIKLWMMTTALSRLGDGSATYELADLERPAREILSWSSNDAATAVTDLVGVENVNRHMLWHGVTRSLLVWWGPQQVNRCYQPGPEEASFGGNNHVTARDATRYLADLHAGHVLDSPTLTWLLETEAEEAEIEFFGAHMPPEPRDVTVFNVPGFNPPGARGPEAMNDVGIVEVRDAGYAFTFAVLTQHNADHTAARDLVAAMGALAFGFFDDLYRDR